MRAAAEICVGRWFGWAESQYHLPSSFNEVIGMSFSPTSDGCLFSSNKLDQLLVGARGKILTEVERVEANQFLNTAPGDLIDYLVQLAIVEPITLIKEKWYVETKDVQIDVRDDPIRFALGTKRTVLIPGERQVIHVPFDGPGHFFFAQSNQCSPDSPRGKVVGNELILQFEYPANTPRDVRPEINRLMADIEKHLGWQDSQIDAHNATLRHTATHVVNERRNRLLAKAQRTAALGIPVRQRTDAPKTYVIPTARRKAAPTLPPATSKPYEQSPPGPSSNMSTP